MQGAFSFPRRILPLNCFRAASNATIWFKLSSQTVSHHNGCPRRHDPGSHFLGELPTKAETLEISTAALAASAIGNMFYVPDLVKTSHTYYTQALRQLQRALHDPLLMRDDETLASCIMHGPQPLRGT